MTKQAKSADDILDMFHSEPAPDGFTKDTQPTALIRSAAVLMYRKAESELLPIINQQAEEIEKLKAESESRWQLAESSINNSAKMSAELSALQSRLDELEHEYKNFHRNLCKRFDFYHDNVEWRGYLASLEEHIAKKLARFDELEHQFKNFHRSLCDRFGYPHDDVDWKRDKVSLEEHIAQKLARFDELVKGLEGVDKWSLDDVKLRGSDELVESRAIQSLISKAKGRANGRE